MQNGCLSNEKNVEGVSLCFRPKDCHIDFSKPLKKEKTSKNDLELNL